MIEGKTRLGLIERLNILNGSMALGAGAHFTDILALGYNSWSLFTVGNWMGTLLVYLNDCLPQTTAEYV